ncbi:MAG: homocysteine S-methyltransferase family protein [Pseudomonadota bacterium]
MSKPRGLLDRIDAGEAVLHAGGYMFEMERRGYLQAGANVPEVVLDHPEVVEQLTREFARCGADVLLAFTYYGNREKMRLIGKEDLLEPLNRNALQIALKVREEFPKSLVAGGICNTNIYTADDPQSHKEVEAMFEEQIGWIADAGVDVIVGETFSDMGEAKIATKVAKQAGIPLVIGTVLYGKKETFRDSDNHFTDDLLSLHQEDGADIVGLNCQLGPQIMLPLIKKVTDKITNGRIMAFPVGYRTTVDQPAFGKMVDKDLCCPERLPLEGNSYSTGLDCFAVTRYEMADFAVKAFESGVRYIGTCCGCGPHHLREMAEALGRTTEASKYSPDMSKNAIYGTDPRLKKHNQSFEDLK